MNKFHSRPIAEEHATLSHLELVPHYLRYSVIAYNINRLHQPFVL